MKSDTFLILSSLAVAHVAVANPDAEAQPKGIDLGLLGEILDQGVQGPQMVDPISHKGCVPRNTIINPSFNHNFDNWTVLTDPASSVDPFPWNITYNGYVDNQIVYTVDTSEIVSISTPSRRKPRRKPRDEYFSTTVGEMPNLQAATYTTTGCGSGDYSLLDGGVVGELWQWVPVCPATYYGFTLQMLSTATDSNCNIFLNISGSAAGPYPFSLSDGQYYQLYSNVIHTRSYTETLLGIQVFCSAAALDIDEEVTIDTVELNALSPTGDGGYIYLNGPYSEDPNYRFYGNYDDLV